MSEPYKLVEVNWDPGAPIGGWSVITTQLWRPQTALDRWHDQLLYRMFKYESALAKATKSKRRKLLHRMRKAERRRLEACDKEWKLYNFMLLDSVPTEYPNE